MAYPEESPNESMSRRDMLRGVAGTAAVGAAALSGQGCATVDQPQPGYVVKGRIKQSIVHWCFGLFGEKWTLDKTCHTAVSLGCKSVELVAPKDWATLRKYGLQCAIAPNGMPGPPFKRGFNNTDNHEELITRMKPVIDACAEFGNPNVIAFNGFKWVEPDNPKSREISLEEGAKNCVEGLKKVIGYAEKKGVNICIEHLNSRVKGHDFKGHPGYQGDHVDYVMDIVKAVGSPNMKILFDLYHVQIMDGDLVTRLRECGEYIGHIHTAGVPGRLEIDGNQEINYPLCMQTLLDIGYKGFVGQEFIPTRDPYAGLAEAVRICDV